MSGFGGGTRDVDRWLSASLDDAQTIVAMLLALPGPELHRQVAASPALRTPGVLMTLLRIADDAVNVDPKRALVLTAVIVRHAASMNVLAGASMFAYMLEARAWMTRAEALRGLKREPYAALARVRALAPKTSVHDWLDALADLIEAPILHDAGRHEEAMQVIQHAIEVFDRYGDHDRYVQAVMVEVWMSWDAGEPDAATRLWQEISEVASQRRDAALMGMLEARIGLFELEHGNAAAAAELLASALVSLDTCGMRREAAWTRWQMAEAAAARDRVHEAISELYKVHAELVDIGAIREAALVSMRIVEFLLIEGRDAAVVGATEMFVRTFGSCMPVKAFAAMTWLDRRAHAAALTPDDVRQVSRYFESAPQDLSLQHDWGEERAG